MTLITYPTRVHFADGVLEEALRAELERLGHRRVMLVSDGALDGSEARERVLSGLPRHVDAVPVTTESGPTPGIAPEDTPSDLPSVDAVVGFGSLAAIEAAHCWRRVLGRQGAHPDLFAIPGADGLPDPAVGHRENWRDGLPSILICDPSLTLGADRAQSQAAAVTSLARCVEGYLSAAYNPPADGMALDGFLRCILNIHRLDHEDSPDIRRELMAACLNAAMAQEKGIGPTQILARELSANSGRSAGEIARLLLPGVLAAMAPEGDKPAVLSLVMGQGGGPLAEGVHDLLWDLPLAARLSDMGLVREDLERAARSLGGRSGLPSGAATTVMEAVF